ncbi:MFS transporter [Natrinema salaciae]|uniref:Sugar phosphate permease n=1 Tax=Natrinema salaciae TaxID=1186196 RepID=A0A1H9NT77_9EURY|nr:MFS transporter [Natrinema salaciae]SER39101.1 Sugar phosphate permease [Natrinema salaciae]
MNWRYAHLSLLLCTLAFMTTMVARLAISPLVPAITDEFAVSNAAVGLALSLMWAMYALLQFPSGILGDRFGERTVILAAIGLTGLSSLCIALAPTYGFFVLFVSLLGVGAGLHYTAATTYLAKQYDDIGRAIGIHIAGSPAAGLVAPVAATAIAVRYGWRLGVLVGLALAVPAFALFARFVRPTEPDRPDEPMRDRFALSTVVALLSRPPVAFTTVLAFLCAFTWQATASFMPSFFAQGQGLSPAVASGLFSLYFLVHGITQPLTGTLSDRAGRGPTTALSMASGIVGYAVLVVGDEIAVYAVGVCFVGLAMSWGAPLQSRFMDLFTAADRGAGFGLVRTVYMTTGASGSVVVGALADLYGWDVSFGLLAAIMAVVLSALATNRLLGLGL